MSFALATAFKTSSMIPSGSMASLPRWLCTGTHHPPAHLASVSHVLYESVLQASEREIIVGTAHANLALHNPALGRLVHTDHLRPPLRNEFSWTALILQHNKLGQGRQALGVYEEMRESGVQPSSYTFVAILKACSSLHDLESTRHIHAELVECGFESDVYVGTMLAGVYLKCGSLVEARDVFGRMPHRNIVSWTAMILGHAQMGQGEVALQLYSQMQQEGVLPDSRAFVAVLKACGSLAALKEGNPGDKMLVKESCLEQVRAIHLDIVKVGLESDGYVGAMLLNLYSKCGSLVDARTVFEKLRHRDVFSWTAMIMGYARMEKGEEALELYTQMQQEGVVPDARAFVGSVKACGSLTAIRDESQGDATAVKSYRLERLQAIHTDIVKRGLELDMYVGSMLVDVYAKCGSLSDARQVFEKMPQRNVVCWTAMILGYAQLGQGDMALQLYSRMQQEGVVPNQRTFLGALMACGIVAALDQGKEIHCHISQTGLDRSDPFVASSLIDMYGRCGSMDDAHQVFDARPTRDLPSWNALIGGYARLGESTHVFDLFERMQAEGIQPQAITFSSILTACSHVGLVDKGQKYFEAMSKDFGITPSIEHYTCMVDLLGRAGQVDNAMALANTMPFQPDSAVWETVLGGCLKWKNVELGRQAFEHAVRLDRTAAGPYILMSNIYARAHMWADAKEIQAMRLNTGAWKQPGQSSWTDLGGVVHAFVVGDKEHPESQDIYAKLQDLFVQMKKVGYVPHLDSVLRDIPDGEKEGALCGHSEKLAIAYALLKTPKGTTIRVVKNLRVCEDCHTATALIAKIEQRTIICRDGSRFHVYKDGKCSCGGYW